MRKEPSFNSCVPSILLDTKGKYSRQQDTAESYSRSITLGYSNNIGFLKNETHQQKYGVSEQRGPRPGSWWPCQYFRFE
jgi:hypothetical protein